MENIKKYEMYINKKKSGVLNINWQVTKKALAYSIAGIITATTLTGCSIVNSQNIVLTEEKEIKFDNIDEEIKEKLNFINCVIEEFQDNNMHPLYQQIMEPYKSFKRIEYEIDPYNEYASFYTEEEIINKKREMRRYLNNAVEIIESNSQLKFGIDYANLKRTK